MSWASMSSSRHRRSSPPPLPKINIAEQELNKQDIAEITHFLKSSPYFKKDYEQKVGKQSWMNPLRNLLETNKLNDTTKMKLFNIIDPETTREMKSQLDTYKKVKTIAESSINPFKHDREMEEEYTRFKGDNPFGGKRKTRRNKRKSLRKRY